MATILSIVVIAGVVVFADHFKTADTSNVTTPTSTITATPTNTSTPSQASTTNSSTTSNYKDGSYTAASSYYVPHGNEDISVSLTLKDGVITDVSIQNSEGDRESAQYQADFASAYKSYVIGKKLSGLQLGVVAGASDTTQGFDDALSQIASKAQA